VVAYSSVTEWGDYILDKSTYNLHTKTMKAPKTLQEAVIYFSDANNCLRYMVEHRWPEGVVCPTCGRDDVTYLETQKKWQCSYRKERHQFVRDCSFSRRHSEDRMVHAPPHSQGDGERLHDEDWWQWWRSGS
jgi:hypothetical protein